MKAVAFILVCLTALSGCLSSQVVTFTQDEWLVKVIEAPGTKDELYIKANRWMVETFNSAKSVIQFSDKESGTIIGRYLMSGGETITTMAGPMDSAEVYATLEVQVKDGKAKVTIKPQEKWTYYSDGMSTSGYDKNKAKNDMNRLATNLENALKSNAVSF